MFFEINAENHEEAKFQNIKIPENMNFDKTIEFLTYSQIDSLKSIVVNKEKIMVIGNGYNGYEFYIWHKPTETGTIYIKAFELTQNLQLSEEKLTERTQNTITDPSNEFRFYKGSSFIYEGTFANFYPTRFELWFKSEISGEENKLTEKSYLIDGWDR